jgi:hypothetical protein
MFIAGVSNLSALSRVLSGRKILPDVLKIRSTGAGEAGMDTRFWQLVLQQEKSSVIRMRLPPDQ